MLFLLTCCGALSWTQGDIYTYMKFLSIFQIYQHGPLIDGREISMTVEQWGVAAVFLACLHPFLLPISLLHSSSPCSSKEGAPSTYWFAVFGVEDRCFWIPWTPLSVLLPGSYCCIFPLFSPERQKGVRMKSRGSGALVLWLQSQLYSPWTLQLCWNCLLSLGLLDLIKWDK